jgi:hypothetical protein
MWSRFCMAATVRKPGVTSARELRQKDPEERNGLFWLNVMAGGDATVGFYSHAELDDNP